MQNEWLPSKHVEPTTLAAYRSYLDKHFFPFFGRRQLHQITPALVQDWVTQAAADGLSASRSASTTPCCTRSSTARSATG